MKTRDSLQHPAIHLVLYLVVPVAINAMCVLNMDKLFPTGSTLVLRGSGMLMAVSWGWAGLFLCALLGAGFGLPIAGMQAVYLRSRLARVERGADVRETLRLDPWLVGGWPWLAALVVAMAVGWVWVFPPLGGPLLAVNALWARTLVYHHELRVYEYLRADAELRQEEEVPEASLVRLPHSA